MKKDEVLQLKSRQGFWAWRLRGWPSGKYRSTGIRDDGTAKARRQAWDLALEGLQKEQQAAPDRLTLRDWAQRFYGPDCPHLAELRAQGRKITARSIQDSAAAIKRNLLPLPIMDMKVAEITRQDSRRARDQLLKNLGQTRTAQIAWGLLRRILAAAHDHDLISKNPLAGLGTIAYETAPRDAFTPADLTALFDNRPGPWETPTAYAVFRLAYLTGLRRAELLALHWEQIKDGTIRVDRAWKDNNFEVMGPPKWGKIREVPVTAEIARTLIWYREQIEPGPKLVFCYPDGTPLGRRWWQDAFTKAMKNAGIAPGSRRLTAHSFRHTIASSLSDGGVPADVIRQVLGWSADVVRIGYTHADQDRARALIEGAMGN